MRENMDIINEFIKKDAFAKYVGIDLVEAKNGNATCTLKIKEEHLNGVNIVHGGAIFALADYTFAAASNSQGIPAVALNANISFMKAETCGSILTAHAKEIDANPKVANYTITVKNEKDDLVAIFQGLAYRKKKFKL